nr:MAG TPA: minor tail protein [Caudoviricetes sp.]
MENINISVGIELDKSQFNEKNIQGEIDKNTKGLTVAIDGVKMGKVSKDIQSHIDKNAPKMQIQMKDLKGTFKDIDMFMNDVVAEVQKQLKDGFGDVNIFDPKEMQKQLNNTLKTIAQNTAVDLGLDIGKVSVTGGKKAVEEISEEIKALQLFDEAGLITPEFDVDGTRKQLNAITKEIDNYKKKVVEFSKEVKNILSFNPKDSAYSINKEQLEEFVGLIDELRSKGYGIDGFDMLPDNDTSVKKFYSELDKLENEVKSVSETVEDALSFSEGYYNTLGEIETLTDKFKKLKDTVSKGENIGDNMVDGIKKDLKDAFDAVDFAKSYGFTEEFINEFKKEINDVEKLLKGVEDVRVNVEIDAADAYLELEKTKEEIDSLTKSIKDYSDEIEEIFNRGSMVFIDTDKVEDYMNKLERLRSAKYDIPNVDLIPINESIFSKIENSILNTADSLFELQEIINKIELKQDGIKDARKQIELIRSEVQLIADKVVNMRLTGIFDEKTIGKAEESLSRMRKNLEGIDEDAVGEVSYDTAISSLDGLQGEIESTIESYESLKEITGGTPIADMDFSGYTEDIRKAHEQLYEAIDLVQEYGDNLDGETLDSIQHHIKLFDQYINSIKDINTKGLKELNYEHLRLLELLDKVDYDKAIESLEAGAREDAIEEINDYINLMKSAMDEMKKMSADKTFKDLTNETFKNYKNLRDESKKLLSDLRDEDVIPDKMLSTFESRINVYSKNLNVFRKLYKKFMEELQTPPKAETPKVPEAENALKDIEKRINKLSKSIANTSIDATEKDILKLINSFQQIEASISNLPNKQGESYKKLLDVFEDVKTSLKSLSGVAERELSAIFGDVTKTNFEEIRDGIKLLTNDTEELFKKLDEKASSGKKFTKKDTNELDSIIDKQLAIVDAYDRGEIVLYNEDINTLLQNIEKLNGLLGNTGQEAKALTDEIKKVGQVEMPTTITKPIEDMVDTKESVKELDEDLQKIKDRLEDFKKTMSSTPKDTDGIDELYSKFNQVTILITENTNKQRDAFQDLVKQYEEAESEFKTFDKIAERTVYDIFGVQDKTPYDDLISNIAELNEQAVKAEWSLNEMISKSNFDDSIISTINNIIKQQKKALDNLSDNDIIIPKKHIEALEKNISELPDAIERFKKAQADLISKKEIEKSKSQIKDLSDIVDAVTGGEPKDFKINVDILVSEDSRVKIQKQLEELAKELCLPIEICKDVNLKDINLKDVDFNIDLSKLKEKIQEVKTKFNALIDELNSIEPINVDVDVVITKETRDSINGQLDALSDILELNIEHINISTDTIKNMIESLSKEISDGLNIDLGKSKIKGKLSGKNIDLEALTENIANETTEELNKVESKVDSISKTVNEISPVELVDDIRNEEALLDRLEQIKATATEISRISYGTDRNGMLKATIKYVNELGQSISEVWGYDVETGIFGKLSESGVEQFVDVNKEISKMQETLNKIKGNDLVDAKRIKEAEDSLKSLQENVDRLDTKEATRQIELLANEIDSMSLVDRLMTRFDNAFDIRESMGIATKGLEGLRGKIQAINVDTPIKTIRLISREIQRLGSGNSIFIGLQAVIDKATKSLENFENAKDKLAFEKLNSDINKANKLIKKIGEGAVVSATEVRVLRESVRDVSNELKALENKKVKLNLRLDNLYDSGIIGKRVLNNVKKQVESMTTANVATMFNTLSKSIDSLGNREKAIKQINDALKDTKVKLEELNFKNGTLFEEGKLKKEQSAISKIEEQLIDIVSTLKKSTDDVDLAMVDKALEKLDSAKGKLEKQIDHQKQLNTLTQKQAQLRSALGELDGKIKPVEILKVKDAIDKMKVDTLNEDFKRINDMINKFGKSETQIFKVDKTINKLKSDLNSIKESSGFILDNEKVAKEVADLENYIEKLTKTREELNGGLRVSPNILTDLIDKSNNSYNTLNATITKVLANKEKVDNLERKINKSISTRQELGVDVAALERIKEDLKGVDLASQDASETIKVFTNEINNLGKSDSQIRKVQDVIDKLNDKIKDIEGSVGAFDLISEDDASRISNMRTEIAKLKDVLKEIENGAEYTTDKLQRMIDVASSSGKSISKLSNETSNIFSGLGSAINQGMQTALGFEFLDIFTDQLMQMKDAIVELDNEMVGLKRVTTASAEEYDRISKAANQTAIEMGKTTQETLNATTAFVKMGYSVSEASDYLSKAGLMLSNVAEMDIDSAVNAIVSTMKGMSLDADDAGTIVDVINEAGNKFALNSEDLAEGLRIGAASLKIAGNDLYESSALITAGTEVLQVKLNN